MADNLQIETVVTPGETIALDDIGGVKFPRSKITLGADGVNDGDVSAANPMPVSGTVTANLGAIDNAVLDAIAASLAGTLTVGSHEVTNAGTFACQVTSAPTTAVTNAALAVTGGGLESTALRVTIASDSTGVLSVDDGGGSLTVDGTVAVSGTVTVDSHAVTNAGTFACQIDGAALTSLQLIDDPITTIGTTPLQRVAIFDASDTQITSFGGGTQYTEGDTDASVTGTALMWEDAADTLRVASATKPFPVNVISGATSGTEYTEGDTDASITGPAVMMEVAADTLQPIQGTVADGLLVNLGSNNDVTVTGAALDYLAAIFGYESASVLGEGVAYDQFANAGQLGAFIRNDTPVSNGDDGDVLIFRGTQYGAQYVQLVTSAGAFIDSVGGGTQYTEGDTDASVTGTALMWEDGADTLRVASAAKPLPVEVIAGATSGTEYTEGATDATITGTVAMMEVAADTLQPIQGTIADGLLVNLGGNNDVTVTGTVTANIGTSGSLALDSSLTTIAGHVDGLEGLLTTIDADTSTLAAVDFATGADVASLAVVGPGLEATALRVTLASDSTGLVSVDDGGGSLTVDGTVAVSGSVAVTGTFWQATQPVSIASSVAVTGPLTDAELRATPVPVSGTVTATTGGLTDAELRAAAVPVSNAGTFAVQVTSAPTTAVTNAALAVTGGGVEASALRVTIASDSTGVLSVDDGGGSLTVDGTVSTVLPNGVLDAFGHIVTGSLNNQIDIQFYRSNGTVGDLVTETNASGGTATAAGGMATFACTTTANSQAKGVTTTTTVYTAGAEIYAIFTAAFTGTGSGTSYQRIGLYDTNDGLFIGYEAGSFGVTLRKGGADTSTAKGSFSEDTLVGGVGSKFTRSGTPEAIDLTKLNVYRIRFGWVGSAPIIFEVLSPDDTWVQFHVIRQPNLAALPSIENADLPITCDVNGGNSSAALSILTNCWCAGTTAGLVQLDATLTDESYASLTRSVLTGETTAGGGGFVNVKVAPSGAIEVGGTVTANAGTGTFTVSGAVTNTVLSVVGGGLEATAQRVTIASDCTGVLSVDDGGSSLTVDGTVGVSGTVTVGSHDVTNSGTFAVQSAQSGTWTVQPGNTANTTAWLVTGTGGTFPITDSGGSITVDNAALSVTGPGVESTALRVTIANDSTGVLSIDDNGGSLTVDNAGTFAVQATQSGTWNIGTVTTLTTCSTLTTLTGGGVAHDAADSGNPVKVGARAALTLSDDTMVANADRTDLVSDADGALIVRQNFPIADILSDATSNTDGASTASSVFTATASTRSCITGFQVFRTDAGTSPIYIDFRDGTAGSVLWRAVIPPNGGANSPAYSGPCLFRTGANTALAYDVSAATSTVYINVSGYKSKV